MLLICFIQDSPPMPRHKGHNPKSPEEDAKGGNLYIRLSDQHRLRKVRNTLYEDPGNPFDSDAFEPPELSTSTTISMSNDERTNNSTHWDHWEEESNTVFRPRAEKEILSVLSDPFDLATTDVHDSVTPPEGFRTLRLSKTPPLDIRESFSSERRTMSVDIGFLPMQDFVGAHGAAVHTDHVSSCHVQHPSGTLFTTSSKRDTEFYEFYGSLLAEYGIEMNQDGSEARSRRQQLESH